MIRRPIAPALAVAVLALAAAPAEAFEVASGAPAQGATLPAAQVLDGFGCKGRNLSPAIAWTNAPVGTGSVAVTLYDPDAPTRSGWWHWTVFDLPLWAHGLEEGASSKPGALPAGMVQGRTDFGTSDFGGACPPPGPAHRYQLTAWALKVPHLGLDASASGGMVGHVLHANALASATLTLRYGIAAR